MNLNILKLLAFFFGCSIISMAGTKEELIRLQSDVLQLQNQIRMLQKSTDDSGGTFKSLLEQLNDRVAKVTLAIGNLVQTVQTQKANISTLTGELRTDLQGLSVKLDDTNNRLASLHQKQEENQLRISSLRSIPAAAEGKIEPDQVYSAAYNDFLMGNYDLAIAGFQDFLTNYPDSEYGDNAVYYYGICFFEQGRYKQAIQAFDQVINLYPKADKSPVAYFKKALAYQQMQKNTNAIETFKQLIEIYSESQEAVRAQQELARMGIE